MICHICLPVMENRHNFRKWPHKYCRNFWRILKRFLNPPRFLDRPVFFSKTPGVFSRNVFFLNMFLFFSKSNFFLLTVNILKRSYKKKPKSSSKVLSKSWTAENALITSIYCKISKLLCLLVPSTSLTPNIWPAGLYLHCTWQVVSGSFNRIYLSQTSSTFPKNISFFSQKTCCFWLFGNQGNAKALMYFFPLKKLLI